MRSLGDNLPRVLEEGAATDERNSTKNGLQLFLHTTPGLNQLFSGNICHPSEQHWPLQGLAIFDPLSAHTVSASDRILSRAWYTHRYAGKHTVITLGQTELAVLAVALRSHTPRQLGHVQRVLSPYLRRRFAFR